MIRVSVGLFLVGSLLFLTGCSEIPIINESNRFSECNARLAPCAGTQSGEYCLFGFKWGEEQTFDEVGIEAIGPRTSGGMITFSFQERNGTVNTHRQVNVPSESWDEILGCAQGEIRNAIEDWEEVADITFQELPENSDSDIQFYVAAILQSAVAFPNFSEDPCNMLGGDVVFDANSRERSCSGFYINALHEIGHVLGLGHVSSQSVMVADQSKFSLSGLQTGDIQGIQEIYGEKN